MACYTQACHYSGFAHSKLSSLRSSAHHWWRKTWRIVLSFTSSSSFVRSSWEKNNNECRSGDVECIACRHKEAVEEAIYSCARHLYVILSIRKRDYSSLEAPSFRAFWVSERDTTMKRKRSRKVIHVSLSPSNITNLPSTAKQFATLKKIYRHRLLDPSSITSSFSKVSSI